MTEDKIQQYTIDSVFTFTHCEVVKTEPGWVYLKIREENIIKEIKKDAIKRFQRLPDFYCDCKKSILINDEFEDLIKIEDPLGVSLGKYNITVLLYAFWYCKKSYGPRIKITSIEEIIKTKPVFERDIDETDSDEEVNEHYIKFFHKRYRNRKLKEKVFF
jgi:hypothetical protein